MEPYRQSSKGMFWAGWIVTGLTGLLLLLDGVMKLIKPQPVIEATLRLGYPQSSILGIGSVLLICTVLYLFPRTSVLGAALLTGYLGGAVATHVRAADGIFPIVFAVVIGTLVWLGIWLRESRLRALMPLNR